MERSSRNKATAEPTKRPPKRMNTQPIDVSSYQWILGPFLMMSLLVMQLVIYRITDELVLVNVPFWCFFLWIWYTRPNTPEDDTVHSVDYITMCLIVQIWIVYGMVAPGIPVLSVYLVRLYSICVLCAVFLSHHELSVLRTSVRENISICIMFSIMVFLPSADAFAQSSHPFVMLWRVVFFCATFILADCQTKIGKTVHIYTRRSVEASKIRDVQTVWILFCWQYSIFIGSIIEISFLIWKVWSAILEKREREEGDVEKGGK